MHLIQYSMLVLISECIFVCVCVCVCVLCVCVCVCVCVCSGDGTMRKNPTIWRSWNPALGSSLHRPAIHSNMHTSLATVSVHVFRVLKLILWCVCCHGCFRLQLRILNRGLELLRPGGRLVYSTCSLNPVENEAVIATILQLCKG